LTSIKEEDAKIEAKQGEVLHCSSPSLSSFGSQNIIDTPIQTISQISHAQEHVEYDSVHVSLSPETNEHNHSLVVLPCKYEKEDTFSLLISPIPTLPDTLSALQPDVSKNFPEDSSTMTKIAFAELEQELSRLKAELHKAHASVSFLSSLVMRSATET
jgi:hypothetical protein